MRQFLGLSVAACLPLGVLVLGLTTGCSKEELNELVEKGKAKVEEGVEQAKKSVDETTKQVSDQATQATQQAKQQLQLAGQMQLQLDKAIVVNGCLAKYTPPTANRAGVLQLRSYVQPESESFPSAMIHLTSGAKNVAELKDQTLTGQLFFQMDKGGPIWQTDPQQPIQVKIVEANDKSLVAEILGGAAHSTPDGATSSLTGNLTGVWQ